MTEEILKPTYKFVEPKEGEEEKTPVKRIIAKTSTVTEHFDVYSTLEYMAKMEKEIESKLAEVEGLRKMKEAFQTEMDYIESQLGVMKMDEKYQKEIAKKNEALLKEELLKTGNFVEKDVKAK
jgi:hypothetical protein